VAKRASARVSEALAEKSVQAAVAAIEVYNKPDFKFREEAFSLLMVNAWELLVKAKWVADHSDDIESLYEHEKGGDKGDWRLNRCGNPITVGLVYLTRKLLEDKNSGLTKPCHDNILALVEIRDNAAHFVNKDLNFGRRILEVGTASLRNYLHLSAHWFGVDLARYNFFLMPISFYHGFETAVSHSVSPYPQQMKNLLDYLDSLEQEASTEETARPEHYFSVRLETRLVRSKDATSLPFRWTDDPKAPEVRVTEEDILKTYPWNYRELIGQLRRRYIDFVENRESHRLRKQIEQTAKLSIVRTLDPRNPKSAKQRFYNPNILGEFDKHYKKRTKARV
jgi:hypothetical protein